MPDAPQATNLSAAESYQPEIPLDLVDIVVTDPDDDVITATLTLSDPAAGVLSEATVLSTSSTYDENTGVWTAAGGVGVVNALLGGVTFTSAAGYTSTFEIDAEVSDGTDSLTGTKPMTLAPVTPVVSIGNASVVEGNVDTAKLQFALTLSAPTTVPVSVRVKTADGTAKAGSDYTARDTVVSIPAGQTTKSFTVLARGDTVVEIVERMSVRLSQPNGVTVGDGKGIGTITNDDRGLRVLTPNGGERWAAGTRHRISWVFGRLSGTLTIQLLRHGEVVRTITRDAVIGDAGRGSFSWKVPASTKVGRGYKIRLVSNKRPGQTDSSNRGFRITSG